MKWPHSLQQRLGISLGALLIVIWLAAAWLTALQLRDEMEEVFDSALQETAQRILPLAVADVLGRDEAGRSQRLAESREHDELLTYVVQDSAGHVLLLSHDADASLFPAQRKLGFSQSASHRFYSESTLQGSVWLTVAEPLAQRREVSRQIQVGLGLPLLVFLPIALLAIFAIVRLSLAPLRRFQQRLAMRGPRDLSVIPADDLPAEVAPIASTLNGLLQQLGSAFEAERSFAANAAHELRTPLAGAIAQAQRLQTETHDRAAQARAAEIEATLKRLTQLSERLMQLARAEGGRLRLDYATDLRMVARILMDEWTRTLGHTRIAVQLPAEPVMSDLDPDVFAIICRNLIENALRHGAPDGTIDVALNSAGLLTVSNDGPVVPAELLSQLVNRFERAGAVAQGSGLGLAIVHAIALRTGSSLQFFSPRPGASTGFAVQLQIPLVAGGLHRKP